MPYLSAMALCIISCSRNPIPTVVPETARAIRKPVKELKRFTPPEKSIAKAKEIVTHAITRSFISLFKSFIIKIKN
jgi:hypothetical protein